LARADTFIEVKECPSIALRATRCIGTLVAALPARLASTHRGEKLKCPARLSGKVSSVTLEAIAGILTAMTLCSTLLARAFLLSYQSIVCIWAFVAAISSDDELVARALCTSLRVEAGAWNLAQGPELLAGRICIVVRCKIGVEVDGVIERKQEAISPGTSCHQCPCELFACSLCGSVALVFCCDVGISGASPA